MHEVPRVSGVPFVPRSPSSPARHIIARNDDEAEASARSVAKGETHVESCHLRPRRTVAPLSFYLHAKQCNARVDSSLNRN